jgi:hypothetical protein
MICGRGYIRLAKWLLTLFPKIHVNNMAFYAAVHFKHKKILDLLYTINPFKFNAYNVCPEQEIHKHLYNANYALKCNESKWKTLLYAYIFNNLETQLDVDNVIDLYEMV